jgi:hypothetical protein
VNDVPAEFFAVPPKKLNATCALSEEKDGEAA